MRKAREEGAAKLQICSQARDDVCLKMIHKHASGPPSALHNITTRLPEWILYFKKPDKRHH